MPVVFATTVNYAHKSLITFAPGMHNGEKHTRECFGI
jgi:hypothetical protein